MSELLRNRYVRAILLSGLFLQIGIWVRNFAVLLFVMEQTNGDAFAVSMISVAEYAPIFLFSFLAGTFADRWRPRRTMVWCEVLSAASVLLVLLAFVFGTWKAIFFATLISAILSQFSQPSGMKLFKLHVPAEHLQTGMSAYQTLFALFMVLGPILGTIVYQTLGMEIAMVITAVAFLCGAAVLYALPVDPVEEKSAEKKNVIWTEMVSGLRYVRTSRVLTLLGFSSVGSGLALGLVQPLWIFIVTERLGLPKESLQWLIMVQGIGMIVGGALVMSFARTIAPQRLLAIGLLGVTITTSIAGFSTMLWLTLSANLLTGLILPCIQIGNSTLIMKSTEAAFIGRVNGIMTPLFTGSMVITMSISGAMKESLSLLSVFQTSAFLFLIGMICIVPILRSSPVQLPQKNN